MASLCKSELGGGNVDLQMVSGYYPAESEEQYAVHVRDQFPFTDSGHGYFPVPPDFYRVSFILPV